MLFQPVLVRIRERSGDLPCRPDCVLGLPLYMSHSSRDRGHVRLDPRYRRGHHHGLWVVGHNTSLHLHARKMVPNDVLGDSWPSVVRPDSKKMHFERAHERLQDRFGAVAGLGDFVQCMDEHP